MNREESVMAVDKKFCMSSYMAFRFIERKDVDFYEDICLGGA